MTAGPARRRSSPPQRGSGPLPIATLPPAGYARFAMTASAHDDDTGTTARPVSAATYGALVAAMDEGCAICELVQDEEGQGIDYRFLEVNRVFEELVGLSPAQVVGRRRSALSPSPDPRTIAAFAGVVTSGRAVRFEHYVESRARWFAVRALPCGGATFAVLYADVTQRREAEERLRASEARQAFLLRLGDALRPLGRGTDVQARATRLLREHLGADRVLYAELHDDGDTIRVIADEPDEGVPSVVGVHRFDAFGASVVATVRAGRTLVIDDFTRLAGLDDDERAAYAAVRVGAAIAVPLVEDGRLVAVLAVHAVGARAWTPAEVSLVEAVAERTWGAVARARAEATLRESEAKYRSLFDGIDEGFAVLEMLADDDAALPDFRVLECNPAQERLTGLRDIVGKTVRELVPGVEDAWLVRFRDAAVDGGPARFEGRVEPLDRWFDVHASRIGGQGSRFVALVFNDITARKRAEEALRESDARKAFLLALSDVLRPLTDPLAIQSAATRLLADHLDASRASYAECDEDEGTCTVRHDYARNGAPSRVGVYQIDDFAAFGDSLRAGRPLVIADALDAASVPPAVGARYAALTVRAQVTVPLVKNGKIVAALTVNQTSPRAWTPLEVALVQETAERTWAAVARAHAELALKTSEARFRTILENVRDYAIFLVDRDGIVTEWTAGAARVKGYAAAEVIGRSLAIFYPLDEVARGEVERELAEAAATGRAERTSWRVRKDGSRFWANDIATAVHDADGRVVGFAKVSRDLSEQRRAEETLRALNESLEQRVAERTAELAKANDARREVMRRLVSAEENERRRISRELHDSLGQLVAGLILGLKTLDGDGREARVVDLAELANRIAREMQTMAVELRPPTLDDLGLVAALRNHLDEWSRRSGIEHDFHAPQLEAVRLSPEVESTAYRLIQEGLTNVLKHADASRVTLVLERRGGVLSAILEDNGRGFDPCGSPESARCLGVRGMRERVALLGGALEIESSRGRGTTIYVRLPDGVPVATAGT